MPAACVRQWTPHLLVVNASQQSVSLVAAGLRFTAGAVIFTTLIACLHSLGTVQVLLFCRLPG